MRYCASDASCGKYSLFKLVSPVFLAEGSKQRYNKAGFNALIHGREIRIPTECHDDKREAAYESTWQTAQQQDVRHLWDG